jgi:hypothetical protein
VSGAKPLYLTCGLILEEGLPIATLDKIIKSMQKTAEEAGVKINYLYFAYVLGVGILNSHELYICDIMADTRSFTKLSKLVAKGGQFY